MGFVLTKLASPFRWIFKLSQNEGTTKKEDPRSPLVNRLALLEAAERDDHQAALALQRGDSLPPPTKAQLEMSKSSFTELLQKLLVAEAGIERYSPAGSSRSTRKEDGKVDCVICCDSFDPITCLNGSCGHFICTQCIISMAEVASKNDDLFPLQCCQQRLPVDAFLSFLEPSFAASFAARCTEAAIPPKFRVYCASRTCSKFLGRSLTTKPLVMSCPECRTEVCSKCKNEAHGREPCEETGAPEVRALAMKKGWQTCPKCKMIVERTAGCLHMTCRCHQSFCYKCGSRGKHCGC